jgi:hypothetical protein
LGLPDQDPLVRDQAPAPDPLSSKNSKKNLDSYRFVTSLLLFISRENDVNVPVPSKSKKQEALKKKLYFICHLEGLRRK